MASNKSFIVDPTLQYRLKSSPLEILKHIYKVEGSEYKIFPHIQAIHNAVQKAFADPNGGRLMISLQSRIGKSLYCVLGTVLWYFLNHPNEKIILISYNAEIVQEWCKEIRRIISDERYQMPLRIRKGSDSNHLFSLEDGSGLLATSPGSTIVGLQGQVGLIIIDDGVKNDQECDSPTLRKNKEIWYKKSVISRLKKNGTIIIDGQRFHAYDFHGMIEHSSNAKRWTHLVLPSLCVDPATDIVGRTRIGQALCPEFYNEKELAEIKAEQGSAIFEIMYQQNVTDESSTIIKRKDIVFYRPWELPAVFDSVYISIDAAFGKHGDYTCISVIGKSGSKYYLIKCVNERMDFSEALNTISYIMSEYPEAIVLLEKAANGEALFSSLQTTGNLILVKVTKSKILRFQPCQPIFEAHNFLFPSLEDKPEMDDIILQVTSFPMSKFDDAVDSISMCLNFCLDKKVYINPFLLDDDQVNYDAPSFSGFKMDID